MFAEMMSAEIHEARTLKDVVERMHEEVLAEIQAGINQGVLVEVPVTTIETVLASPAITLAMLH